MNIFLKWNPLQIPYNTWITHVDFMNTMWSLQPNKWNSKIFEFFEWLDWKATKGKTSHIFPFMYGL